MDITDIHAIVQAMRQEKRPNTRKSYGLAYRRFEKWCEERGYDALPAESWTVAAYLAHRVEHDRGGQGPDGKLGIGSIEMDLKAIRDRHRQDLKPSPTDDVVVKRVVAGLREKLAGRPPKQARGLTAERFAVVREVAHHSRTYPSGNVESVASARRRATREIALIRIMRDALLRAGEASALEWRDIHVRADGTGRVVVRQSKTSREPAVQPLRAGTVAALEKIRPDDAEPTDSVFSMSPKVVNRTVGGACSRAGLGEGFSGHSCRIGMAQDLMAAGFDLASIMQAGRWASPRMVARYTEKLSANRGAVALLPED